MPGTLRPYLHLPVNLYIFQNIYICSNATSVNTPSSQPSQPGSLELKASLRAPSPEVRGGGERQRGGKRVLGSAGAGLQPVAEGGEGESSTALRPSSPELPQPPASSAFSALPRGSGHLPHLPDAPLPTCPPGSAHAAHQPSPFSSLPPAALTPHPSPHAPGLSPPCSHSSHSLTRGLHQTCSTCCRNAKVQTQVLPQTGWEALGQKRSLLEHLGAAPLLGLPPLRTAPGSALALSVGGSAVQTQLGPNQLEAVSTRVGGATATPGVPITRNTCVTFQHDLFKTPIHGEAPLPPF